MKSNMRILPAVGLLAALLVPHTLIEAGRAGGRGGGSGHGGGARASGRASAPARGPSARSASPSRGGAPRAGSTGRSTSASGRSAHPSPYGSQGRASSATASRQPSGNGTTTARGRATYGYGYGYGYGGYYPYYPYYYNAWYPYYYPYYPCYWNGWDWSWGVSVGWYGYPSFNATVYVGDDGGYTAPSYSEDGSSDYSIPAPPAVIETKVQPKKAEVWVDGALRGQARDFNGAWDSLSVSAGDHVIEFRLDGHQTLRMHMRTAPGVRYVIAEDLPEGSGVIERGPPPEPVQSASAGDVPAPRFETTPGEPGTLRRGLLRISVTPPDGAVYLDGEFLSSGDALARLHGALPVAVGTHVIEVTRPGFESDRREVDVESGAPTEVEVVLARTGSR